MRSIGVIGAGTMGAGIAELALARGHRVALYDVSSAGLARAQATIAKNLEKLHARGKLAEDPGTVIMRLLGTTELGPLAGAQIVIEAAPEVMDLKRDLFAKLDEVCPGAILATNTSTLSVSAIAAGVRDRSRVVGMHFFNPAQVMPLVEVIPGDDTAPEVVETIRELAVELGKTPVICGDTPGFIVNRVARPFYGEGLRLAAEGVASYAELDRIVRGAGFRMGPFELMDLIGLDINLASTQSVYEAFFGDPKYRPHPLQARMVASGRLGRKTGRGFYDHTTPAETTAAPKVLERPDVRLHFCGSSALRGPLEARLAAYPRASAAEADWIVDCSETLEEKARLCELRPRASVLSLVWPGSATTVAALAPHPERVVGFSCILPLSEATAVEVMPALQTQPGLADTARDLLAGAGFQTALVGETPGGVAARTVAMLANEAVSALAEGVADAATIDTAMKLGTNYPRGPLDWARILGPRAVLGILDGLHAETGDDRYRPHPLPRRVVRARLTDFPSGVRPAPDASRSTP